VDAWYGGRVTGLSYRLAVLTHGDNDDLVDQALEAFHELVTPQPAAMTIHHDDGAGFCAATAELWRKCVDGEQPWAVCLEHDFVVDRPVDLRDLAAVIDQTNRPLTDLERPMHGWAEYRQGRLAQMALMRDAYSTEERAAGGLFELRRDAFTPMIAYGDDFEIGDQMGSQYVQWLRMGWFTTNPSLMRRDFMEAHPFLDDGQPHCEGRFGVALAAEGWSFGTWGAGDVYCRHVGVRTGHGY
jgi:hypothetical protein